MSHIRWRLIMGVLSLAATLALTAPAVASRFANPQVSEIWPNSPVTDIIGPTSPLSGDQSTN
jgi:hypothetical protein